MAAWNKCVFRTKMATVTEQIGHREEGLGRGASLGLWRRGEVCLKPGVYLCHIRSQHRSRRGVGSVVSRGFAWRPSLMAGCADDSRPRPHITPVTYSSADSALVRTRDIENLKEAREDAPLSSLADDAQCCGYRTERPYSYWPYHVPSVNRPAMSDLAGRFGALRPSWPYTVLPCLRLFRC
jgi:hypothetical protein